MSGETHLVRAFTEELTREDTTVTARVRRIVEWGQRNLPHYHEGYGQGVYGAGFEEGETGNADDVSIRDVFRERVVGCHLAVFTLVTMLRSIGIQADYVRSEDLRAGEEGHGILYIPELDRYVHGDDVCLGNLWPTDLVINDQNTLVARLGGDAEAREAFLSGIHSGGFLRRDGNNLFIEGGVIHAGYEETELARLRAMYSDFDITLNGPYSPNPSFGTAFATRRVPIGPLE